MAEQPFRQQNDLPSKCRTNTFPQTKSSSSRICPTVLRKNSSMLCFLSCVSIVCFLLSCTLLNNTPCVCDQLTPSPFHRYPNLHEVRLIPTKKDIAFVEFMDEGSATVAKDALHNYKLDGENKIKVRFLLPPGGLSTNLLHISDHVRKEVERNVPCFFCTLCLPVVFHCKTIARLTIIRPL